jgi:hypothetical protein
MRAVVQNDKGLASRAIRPRGAGAALGVAAVVPGCAPGGAGSGSDVRPAAGRQPLQALKKVPLTASAPAAGKPRMRDGGVVPDSRTLHHPHAVARPEDQR